MRDGVILLGQDDPDDVALTLRALAQHRVTNEVVVTQDSAAAFEYSFAPASC